MIHPTVRIPAQVLNIVVTPIEDEQRPVETNSRRLHNFNQMGLEQRSNNLGNKVAYNATAASNAIRSLKLSVVVNQCK